MAVFDTAGAFPDVVVVDVSDNSKLNVTMDFDHLNGVAMQELHLIDTNINDKVDFGYITSWLYIELDTSVRCVTSACSGNAGGRTVSWDRLRSNCTGQDDCLDTCVCISRYAAGLEQGSHSEEEINVAAEILFFFVLFFVLVGIVHSKSRYRNGENFDLKPFLFFCLQAYNFLTDVLMYFSIYDYWYEESFDSPDKPMYHIFTIVSGTFVALPWVVNLAFLLYEIHKIENGYGQSKSRSISTMNWVSNCNNWVFLFVVFCFSGSAVTTIQLLNCNLLGLKVFEMGLSMPVLSGLFMHYLWLTVVLESIPQLILIVLWNLNSVGFYLRLVLFMGVLSSFLSIVVGIYAANMTRRANFYLYQATIQLATPSTDQGSVQNLQLAVGRISSRVFSEAIIKGIDRNGLVQHPASIKVKVNLVLPSQNTTQNSLVFNVVSNKEIENIDKEKCENIMFEIVKALEKNGVNAEFDHGTMQWQNMGLITTHGTCNCSLFDKICDRQDDSTISNTITSASNNNNSTVIVVEYVDKQKMVYKWDVSIPWHVHVQFASGTPYLMSGQ